MIYINGRAGLDCSALESLRNIISAPSSQNVATVVEIGLSLNASQCDNKVTPQWSGIRRFAIRHAMAINPGPADAPPSSIIDMGSADTLDEFLSWAQHKFPAKQYMLVIWGHGLGPSLTLEQFGTHSRSCSTATEFAGTTKGVFIDDGSGRTLFNRDIGNVLRKLKHKLSIIGFDACLMGNVETAYALREGADIMVASEHVVPVGSWDYKYALGALAKANGQTNAPVLSKFFVEGYGIKYDGCTYQNIELTLSAVDLRDMTSLAGEISILGKDLSEKLSQQNNALTEALEPVNKYGPANTLVDLSGLLGLLEEHSGDVEIITHAKAVRSRIASAVIAKVPSTEASSGMTIYLPQNVRLYNSDALDRAAYDLSTCTAKDRDKKHTVDFVCDTAWASFVHAFLKVP